MFKHHGFPLTPKQSEQLTIYRSELKRWNARINLTAIEDDSEIIYKHFLDSISILEHFAIGENQTVIDIGTGAGFPGVVLKIYIPAIDLTLVEASQKKVAFLKYLISKLGLNNAVKVIAKRAETCAKTHAFINTYDLVLTRYVATLEKSAKYCLPLLKATGKWIAYKSIRNDTEIHQSEQVLHQLGAKIEHIHTSSIPQINRSYIVVCRVDRSKNNLL